MSFSQKVNLDSIYQFENARCLTNFEANELFTNADNNINNAVDQNDTRKQLFDKASNYASSCQQFNNADSLIATREAIKRILKDNDLDDDDFPQNITEEEQEKLDRQIEYDTVMLLNLCPGTVEDARAYIPSLKSKSENQVHEIITQLTKFRI